MPTALHYVVNYVAGDTVFAVGQTPLKPGPALTGNPAALEAWNAATGGVDDELAWLAEPFHLISSCI